MSETYREEQEANVAERIMEDLNTLVGANVFELEDEPEDVNEEVESEYEDDEMIYN